MILESDDVRVTGNAGAIAAAAPIPAYLEQVYWWAYVHPAAVRVFERQWLANLILLGNFSRLRDAALGEFGRTIAGRTLQIACVYGDLTQRLAGRIAPGSRLDVVDVLPIQLRNLGGKLAPGSPVRLLQHDSARLGLADASYDQVLLFFLLHEQPEAVRRRTLAEALRVVKPGGRVVVVDYHGPVRRHPLRRIVKAVLRRLEPYALDLWRRDLRDFLPAAPPVSCVSKETFFGGLYQKLTIVR